MEIIKGNKNYDKYTKEECVTSLFQLYELYFQLLREFGSAVADTYFQKYVPLKIEITNEDIPKASVFRLTYLKQNISYVDALGYTLAKERGIKFLTGDKEFEKIPNVEFVK